MIALETLLARLPASARIIGDRRKGIASIEIDSRKVAKDALFIAVEGEHVDGHDFIEKAIASGATAIVADEAKSVDAPDRVTVISVPDTRRALSAIAAAFFGDPSHELDVIGVTGTNGKTTTSHMIAAILNAANVPCGVIGTVGARFDRFSWTLENTTPLPLELHGLLREMRNRGARAVAMEVSSHSLVLDRVEDVRFRVGVFTNLTRDHLDFHGTFDAYAAAKRRLFSLADAAVLNVDDEHGERWAAELRRRIRTLTYSLKERADLVPSKIDVGVRGISFVLDGRTFSIPISGRFNVSNALAAIGVARVLGIGDDVSEHGLYTIGGVPGRMEYVGDGIVNAYVDYAHTPDALYQALWALREATNNITLVFGCGGDRDRGKRAEMGRIAAEHARTIIVTNDNPRTEDPLAIIRDIEEGLADRPHVVEPDRAKAIERAVETADPGSIVLIAGKGHEKYQIVGTETQPFDDAEVARAAIAARRLRA